MNYTWVKRIPAQDFLKKRFDWIDNEILKDNLAIAFQYIIFLILLEETVGLPGAISYSIYKDIILYTAAIVESCIHHCVGICLREGKIKSTDIMPWEWKMEPPKLLYKINEDRRVVGATAYKSHEKFNRNTRFLILNRAALQAEILNKGLFDKSENLRMKRNKIHLAGLKKVDDYYEKSDLDKVFSDTSEILERLKTKTSELRSTVDVT